MSRLLLAIVLLVCSYQISAQSVPLLIENVKGYTLDVTGKLHRFSTLLVDEGKVLALDPAAPPNNATRIDGKGKVLLPGLIDAHGHVNGLGESLVAVDLRNTSSVQQAVALVGERTLGGHQQGWLTGRGWNQELWSDRAFPTAQQLDALNTHRPIWLTRVDGHAGWANSKALQLAGINESTPDPEGGQIIRDSDGRATGILIDNAMSLIESKIPPAGSAQLSEHLRLAGEHLVSLGITAVHDAGISHQQYDFYMAKALAQQLPVRIYAMLAATDPLLAHMLDNGVIQSPDDKLIIRSVKAYSDGALGSRGAALLKPYSDDHDNVGLLLTPPAQLPQLYEQVLSHGFQLNVHAIGDRANQLVLDQFEQSFLQIGGKELRNRVEHAQVIDVNDLGRFAQLGVLPSMQPTHATSDMNMAEDRLGAARMKGAYAWKTLVDSGIPVPLGSDFPVELANPFHGIHAAVTRENHANQPSGGWYPQEKLSIQQALKGFTVDAAYAAHMEGKVGTLMPGAWADFILVDRDLFESDAEQLWQTQVLATYIAGKQVYPTH